MHSHVVVSVKTLFVNNINSNTVTGTLKKTIKNHEVWFLLAASLPVTTNSFDSILNFSTYKIHNKQFGIFVNFP